MVKRITDTEAASRQPDPLTMEELEIGLLQLGGPGDSCFWDKNIRAFRESVLAAIRDTKHILDSEDVPPKWRSQLDRQLHVMLGYIEIADQYLARQGGPSGRVSPHKLN